ncbi:MAG: hypothetical protein GXP50_05335, partial [Deltaproteobacteria bacterium]|nr:hypothetical protein [Deltaproteobacteria bacterium]
YGEALNDREKVAPGVIEVFNTPFRINVPLVVVGPQEGDSVWVGFPSEVLPDEKVLDWLVSPPNLSKLGEAEQLRGVKKITEIGTAIRSIRIDLMTATAPSDDLQLFIGSIPLHCDKCAELIIKADVASLALATWEMHLALEKSLKLVIRQQGETPGNIHDLLKLADKATKAAKIAVDMTALRKLPSGKEAIKARYGEGRQRPLEEVLANYRQAMGLIASITKSLKRKIVLNNARFLIRNPFEPIGA